MAKEKLVASWLKITNQALCIGCHEEPIVNKHFKLGRKCNELRLNGGKTKAQVYQERYGSLRGTTRRVVAPRSDWSAKVPGVDRVEPKKRKAIAKVSKTARYHCSDGTLVSQAEINENLKIVYGFMDLDYRGYCSGCTRTNQPMSHSHTISQARCKLLGKTELIWDVRNIEFECFEGPCSKPTACHNKWEVGSLEVKKTLINFTRKLEYIKLHDQETYRKLTL
jgi:hypothetical protein